MKLNEELDVNKLKENIADFLHDIVKEALEDGLANNIATKFPEYQLDWCLVEGYTQEIENSDLALDAYINSQIDILFANYNKFNNSVTEDLDTNNDEDLDESLEESVEEKAIEVVNPVMADAIRDQEEAEEIKKKATEITKDGVSKLAVKNESFNTPWDDLKSLEESIKRGK